MIFCASCTVSKIYSFEEYDSKYFGTYNKVSNTFNLQPNFSTTIDGIVKYGRSKKNGSSFAYENGLIVTTSKCRMKKLNALLEPTKKDRKLLILPKK